MRAELEESPHGFTCLPGSSAAGVPTQRALEMQLSVGLSHWDAPLWNGGRFYVAVGTIPGGAALQPVVSQCCPSEVQAPVTTTELSWVVTLLWEQETQESFQLINDA